MSDEEQNSGRTLVIKKAPLVDGKTLVVGGGLVALIIFLFFREGGGSGGKRDKQRLHVKMRTDGYWIGDTHYVSITDVISRILQGGRKDLTFQSSGDVTQSAYDFAVTAFQSAGLTVYSFQPQSVSSIYQRGLGGGVA